MADTFLSECKGFVSLSSPFQSFSREALSDCDSIFTLWKSVSSSLRFPPDLPWWRSGLCSARVGSLSSWGSHPPLGGDVPKRILLIFPSHHFPSLSGSSMIWILQSLYQSSYCLLSSMTDSATCSWEIPSTLSPKALTASFMFLLSNLFPRALLSPWGSFLWYHVLFFLDALLSIFRSRDFLFYYDYIVYDFLRASCLSCSGSCSLCVWLGLPVHISSFQPRPVSLRCLLLVKTKCSRGWACWASVGDVGVLRSFLLICQLCKEDPSILPARY